MVTVQLASSRVRVAPLLARGGIGRQESMASMARRTAPEALITGSFFDTRTLRPIGDIVVDGDLIHFGGRGAGLVLRRDRRRGTLARLRSNAGLDRHTRWGQAQHVLAGTMWLLRDGKPATPARKQGFGGGVTRPSERAAVGLTADNQMLLTATSRKVSLKQWAAALRALGARDALNLDGGSSTGLYFQGQPVLSPGRKLTNTLAVYLCPAPKARRAR